MAKLILVRHGESLGNRERVFAINPAELPLTDLGYRQARDAAHQIAALYQPELVVASPYLRARETARVIAQILNLPLEIEPNLYERDVGVFKGESYDSLQTAPGFDERAPWTWKPDGGESYEDVRARVAPILDRLAQTHPSRDVIVVSHGGVMQTLWSHVTGTWFGAHAPANCGIVMVEHGPRGYSPPCIIGDASEAADAGG
jgi:broad specificity phosphatase PhoE